jgi:hypothetical protein
MTVNSTLPQYTVVGGKVPSPSGSKVKITADTTQDVSQISFDRPSPSRFIKDLKNYQRGSVRVDIAKLNNLTGVASSNFPTEQNESVTP